MDSIALSNRELPAGARLTLSGAVEAGTNPGEKTAQIDAFFTNGTHCAARVRAAVRGTWTVSPDRVDFGSVALDGAALDAPVAAILRYDSQVDRLLGDPSADISWLQVVDGEPPSDGYQRDIILSVVRERLVPGLNAGNITISTTNSIKPAATVPVRAVAYHEIEATPQHVFPTDGKTARVRFRLHAGGAVRLTRASAESDSFELKLLDGGIVEIRDRGLNAGTSATLRVWDNENRCGSVGVTRLRKGSTP